MVRDLILGQEAKTSMNILTLEHRSTDNSRTYDDTTHLFIYPLFHAQQYENLQAHIWYTGFFTLANS